MVPSFAEFATRIGFSQSHYDSSLFNYRFRHTFAYLLLYVDDIVLTTSSQALLQQLITSLRTEFAMTDMGHINYFLGISIQRTRTDMVLNQNKYVLDIHDRAQMMSCNPFALHPTHKL